MTELVRLNKWIAESGLCSRREADRLIEAGRITVNGRVTKVMGTQVNPDQDIVKYDGQVLRATFKVYLLFHKPKGCITTRADEKGRKTIYDFIPRKWQTVDPAGRLDRNSTGAMILSNDGDFLYRLTHPKFHLPKVYRVTVEQPLDQATVNALLEGIMLEPENKLAKAEAIEVEDSFTLKMTLVTGYNRQIRRCLEALNYEVTSLKRLSIGPVKLGDLKPGDVRLLSIQERRELRTATRDKGEVRKSFPPRGRGKFRKKS